jgi:hypothetical protein
VLDTSGFVVARMNEWTSRDGYMYLHLDRLLGVVATVWPRDFLPSRQAPRS